LIALTFYDRAGREIDAERLRELYALGNGYRQLGYHRLMSLGYYEKTVIVVTQWEGTDHGMGDKRIFASVVFGGKMDGNIIRYPDYTAAMTGHQKLVTEIKKELRL